MNAKSLRIYPLIFIGVAISYIVFSLFLVHSTAFQTHSDKLSLAITLDYCLVLPIIFYFLVVKKLKYDAILTIISLVPAVAIASFILPKDNHFYLNFAIQGLVLVEISVLVHVILKIRKITQTFNQFAQNSTDFIENVERSFAEVMGHSAAFKIVVSEIVMLYYALFFWRAKTENTEGVPSFTVYRKAGYGAMLAVLIVVGSMEMLGMHVLVSKYSPTSATVLTVLSIYSLLFIIADFAAMNKRPILIKNDVLKFRIGLRWSASIPVSDIETVEIIKNFKKDKTQKILNAALLGNPNCKMTFKKPVTVGGIYNIKKTVSSIVFNIDDEKLFIDNFSKI